MNILVYLDLDLCFPPGYGPKYVNCTEQHQHGFVTSLCLTKREMSSFSSNGQLPELPLGTSQYYHPGFLGFSFLKPIPWGLEEFSCSLSPVSALCLDQACVLNWQELPRGVGEKRSDQLPQVMFFLSWTASLLMRCHCLQWHMRYSCASVTQILDNNLKEGMLSKAHGFRELSIPHSWEGTVPVVEICHMAWTGMENRDQAQVWPWKSYPWWAALANQVNQVKGLLNLHLQDSVTGWWLNTPDWSLWETFQSQTMTTDLCLKNMILVLTAKFYFYVYGCFAWSSICAPLACCGGQRRVSEPLELGL